jgi:GT2 family glycosyltransferase
MVDVIIPIYVPSVSTFEILKECVSSVIRSTDSDFQLILINDKSPLKETQLFLEEFKEAHAQYNIVILENESNLGFVGTVNKGMQFSNHDVVLLNSDTVVTKGWLRKMNAAAYSDHKIATVSPFSNSATILSLPNFCEDNDLPEGYTPDELNALVERYFPKIHLALPTAHGFCMYIKRLVLNEVGLFDEEKFGKGYGEENDFSNRCLLAGYNNVLDSKTFIYHKGEASFQGAKANVGENSLAKIRETHPFYEFSVQDFILRNPLYQFQQVYQSLTDRKIKVNQEEKIKGNILVVTHDLIGGSDKFAHDLFIKNLSAQYNVFILKNAKSFASLLFPDFITDLQYDYDKTFYSSNEISNLRIREIYRDVLTECEIDLVFINSFINTTFDVVDESKSRNIPVFFEIHDYNSICPSNTFILKDNTFCGICKLGEEKKDCLMPIPGHLQSCSTEMLYAHRIYFKNKVIPNITQFIFPSNNSYHYFNDFFKPYDINYQIIEHGIEINTNSNTILPTQIEVKRPLNVAFVGAIGYHKGLSIINHLVNSYKVEDVQFHLFGYSINPIANIVDHGEYQGDELISLLQQNKIDVVILPSIAPETFMYTISESWAAGIPVIVNNIGAPKERVEVSGLGWVVDFTQDTYLSQISDIFNNKNEISALKLRLINERHRTVKDMVQDYKVLFNRYALNNTKKEFASGILIKAYDQRVKEFQLKSQSESAQSAFIHLNNKIEFVIHWLYKAKINYIYKLIRKVYAVFNK